MDRADGPRPERRAEAYVGIYFWNNGSPDLMLFKRISSSWTQLGCTYNSGALAAGTQLHVR